MDIPPNTATATTTTPTTPTPTPISVPYYYITPSALPCRPRRNRCVFSRKKRLAFILTVNLFTADDPLAPLAMFSHVKCALYRPPQIPCVFSGQMRLAFTVTVNSYDTRPTLPDSVFFSTKTCVAETLPDSVCFLSSPTFLVFFKENARRRNPATFLGFTFIVFSEVLVQCVLGSQGSVNSHAMLPGPAGCRFFFQGKTRLAGIAGKSQSWNKGIC